MTRLWTREESPPCVQCGYCCKQSPCDFGEWDAELHRCVYLSHDNLCLLHSVIPFCKGAVVNPAFDAGCCSSLNSDRHLKIKNLKERL